MSTIQDAIKSVQDYGNQFSKTLERHRGFLGDGAGTIYVANRDGYVYVRHRQAESADITGTMEPEEVIYSRSDIPPIEGYPVVFGRDIDTEDFQVLATDTTQLLGWIFDKYIKDHHEQHEFNEYDTVWIQKQAMLPLLVHPTFPVSTTVQVYAGWYQWDTDWHYFETTTSAELSSYVPTGAGQARFLLICIDGETETLHYEVGDTFLEFIPPRDCEDRIPPPPDGKIPLAAIYLVVGETSFDWDIIYDVRLLFSGGGSMSTGSAPRDAAYITLAYNDTLSAERLLSAGHGIVVTDNGPNDTVEISVDSAADYNWSGDHNFNVGEMGLPSGTSFPANPQDGDIFYRTDEDNLYVYDGGNWIEVGILVHNELTGLQGGQANEYYHFTQAQHTSFTVVAGAGYALVSTGANIWAADQTPLWQGTHTWGSGLAIMPTDASGQDLGDATHRWDLHTQAVYFEGTTNNNTITVPDNIAIALKVVDAGGLEYARVVSTDANPLFLINPAGTGIKVGIGTATVPHGGIGWGKFAIDGTTNSMAGPHVLVTVSADDYPVFQQLNWAHDVIEMMFDAYYDGAYKSSDVGSNCNIRKRADQLDFLYDSGVAQGGAVTWNNGIIMGLTNGAITVGGPSLTVPAAWNLIVPDNVADAFGIDDVGGLEYLRINSANVNPYFLIDPGAVGVKVGVNCTPTARFQVEHGTAGEWAGYIKHTDTGGNAYGLKVELTDDDAADIAFGMIANADWKMIVKGDGTVGFGFSTPDSRVHIYYAVAASNDNLMLRLQNPTTAADVRVGIAFAINANTGALWDGFAIQAINDGVGVGDLGFYSVANNALTLEMYIDSDVGVGIGCIPNSLMEWNFSTENLEFVDAGSAGATEQDWVQVEVGGVTGYIRVFAAK